MIFFTGMKTFAKEPMLANLLRELKYYKKRHWVFTYVFNPKLVVFRVLCCGTTY